MAPPKPLAKSVVLYRFEATITLSRPTGWSFKSSGKLRNTTSMLELAGITTVSTNSYRRLHCFKLALFAKHLKDNMCIHQNVGFDVFPPALAQNRFRWAKPCMIVWTDRVTFSSPFTLLS